MPRDIQTDDTIIWPDGDTCRGEELNDFSWKSDDFVVIPFEDDENKQLATYSNGLAMQGYRDLRKCLGYIENGTHASVTICQDDATREWVVRVDKESYVSRGLSGALSLAAADQEED
jgi:hypothetical protein